MITGSSSADAAILVVDALEGIKDQTRRHGYLLHLIGIDSIVVLFNKMDLIDYDKARYTTLLKELENFLGKLGIGVTHFVPISAKQGENISIRSSKLDWFNGPTLLEAIDHLRSPRASSEIPLRFSVQDVYRFEDKKDHCRQS